MSWRSATFLVWGILAASVLVVTALAFARRARVARPGPLLDRRLAHPVVRIAVVVGWMWLGWHFFAR